MKIIELIKALSRTKGRQITQAEIARALITTEAVISNKKSRGTEITVSELLACCKYFDCAVENVISEDDKVRDAREIVYYENKNLGNLIKHPDVTSVWKDRQVLYFKWRKKEENLRAISMLGDSMDGGPRPIKNGDMLIIDTTEKSTLVSGIYAYTTEKQDTLYVAYIKQHMDEIIFKFFNPNCEDVVKTPDELKALGFKIIGRVIHNDSELW